MKYDSERLLDDLFNIVKSNLNAKIEQIQLEKQSLLGSGNFAVPLIDDNAWFDSLDDRTANFDPYVYYGLSDDSVVEIATAEGSEFTIFFMVVLHYNGSDASMFRKMLRYIRALREVVVENCDTIADTSRLIVSTVNPNDMRDLDGDTFHKIGGITIKTSIA